METKHNFINSFDEREYLIICTNCKLIKKSGYISPHSYSIIKFYNKDIHITCEEFNTAVNNCCHEFQKLGHKVSYITTDAKPISHMISANFWSLFECEICHHLFRLCDSKKFTTYNTNATQILDGEIVLTCDELIMKQALE